MASYATGMMWPSPWEVHTVKKQRFIPMLLALTMLVTALSACTIRIRPLPGFEVVEPTAVLTEFHPVRSSYRVGERFEFVVRATDAGYLTVTEYGPNNRANTIVSRKYIAAGRTIVPERSDRFTFTVAAPYGSYRLVARFTPWDGGPDDVREARYTVY